MTTTTYTAQFIAAVGEILAEDERRSTNAVLIGRRDGDEMLVTLDAGWGTLSFWVGDDGSTRQAGLGESVGR